MELQQGMEESQNTARPGVGNTLREARERAGMSVEEVAIRLKFAPRQIVALEEENFAQLPELAFVRGFVRSYARLLQIDETPLLEALPGAPAREQAYAKRAREDVVPGDSGSRNQNLLWLAGALAVAVVIVILAWKYDAGESTTKPAQIAKTASETPAGTATPPAAAMPAGTGGTTNPATPSAETQGNPAAQQPARENASASPAKTETPAAVTAKAAAQRPLPRPAQHPAAQAASAVSGASAVAATPRKPRASQMVRLEFDEDSWVEVKDKNGKVLLSMMGKQGTSQSVAGPVPISVTIGNPKGVRVYYKNQPLDLGTSATQDVARLKLE